MRRLALSLRRTWCAGTSARNPSRSVRSLLVCGGLPYAKAGPPQTAAAALLRMRAPGGIVGGAVFSFSMAKPAADL